MTRPVSDIQLKSSGFDGLLEYLGTLAVDFDEFHLAVCND
jgi:hypothetical protein